jgi:hypothetical protein
MNMRQAFAGVALIVFAALGSGEVLAGVISGPTVSPTNGHKYYLLSPDTWTGSEASAVGLGGHLATVRSQAENDWLVATYSSLVTEPTGSLLIGFTDPTHTGSFGWVSGAPVTYTNWGSGEPNNIGTEIYSNLLIHNFGSILAGQWNNTTTGASNLPQYGVAEVVPEPTHLAVSAVAAVFAFARRGRRTARRL